MPPVVAPPVQTGLVPVPPSLPVDTASGAVTDVHIASTSTAEQSAVPVTFGQVFAVGDVNASTTLRGKLPDGKTLPLQMDVKVRHPDGSARHAVLSALLPKLAASQTQRIVLVKTPTVAAPPVTSPAALLADGFTTSVQVDLGGVRYTASADALLKAGKVKPWLSGPVVTEWLLSAPLAKSDGTPHPHLTARFAVRSYTGTKQARVDVILENNWAYEAAPRNLEYTVNVQVGSRSAWRKDALKHTHHARWRKVFWWGTEPKTHIIHNVGYLIDSKAVPNYDRTIRFPHTRLDAIKSAFSGAKTEPMAVGMALPYMPSTGGRPDIGLLPAWATTYLLTMDQRAKDATLGTADLAGSWSIHYRDQETDQPVSLHDYPYMTTSINVGDTYNPTTKKFEAFPKCATDGACTSPHSHDVAHQPSFAYLPYMVTGDHYYLEELQFWGMYNAFHGNPGYRELSKGLVKSEQVRGQAWALRTIANAAWITPDTDRLKQPFEAIVKANLDWYNATYTDNPNANKLGIMAHARAIAYADDTSVGPWLDDFLTSSFGHLADLGYSSAVPLLKWKSKFSIGRMTDPGACWVSGAIYALKVRDSATSPIYETVGQAWRATSPASVVAAPCGSAQMATLLGVRMGEMTGYAGAATGYPSNMQPALAYAARSGAPGGKEAWDRFMSRTIKPDYSTGPQFAIVPR